MDSWIDFLADATPIRAIFGDQLPSGAGLVLHEVTVNRDGPGLIIRLEFSEFPASPPVKWAKQHFNRVQMQLHAAAVHDLSLIGAATDMVVDLDLSAENAQIRLILHGPEITVNCLTAGIVVSKISAYQTTLPD